MTRLKFACIGECMIEFNHFDLMEGTARLGFAGDTLNTSVYLSRLGCDVSYITNLGTDAFSTQMLHRFNAEGINCDLIGQHETCLPANIRLKLTTGVSGLFTIGVRLLQRGRCFAALEPVLPIC